MNRKRTIVSRVKDIASNIGDDPKTDWRLALALFALSLLVVVAIDAYLSFELTRPEADAEAQAKRSVILDRAALRSAAESMQARSAAPRPIPEAVLRDPSL